MYRLPASLRQLVYQQGSGPKASTALIQSANFVRRISGSTSAASSLQRFSTEAHFPRSNFRPSRISAISRAQHRHNSSLAVPGSASTEPIEDLRPSYQLTFTCKPCGHRSSHRVTKQGYHHGTVLIQCPSCKNRHVIADHLKVFLDQKSTLEDILRKHTQDGKPLTNLIKKGKLGIRQGSMVGNEGEEDIEFWEDGTESVYEKPASKP
jgi:mitochondrial protein import protein ZIM17